MLSYWFKLHNGLGLFILSTLKSASCVFLDICTFKLFALFIFWCLKYSFYYWCGLLASLLLLLSTIRYLSILLVFSKKINLGIFPVCYMQLRAGESALHMTQGNTGPFADFSSANAPLTGNVTPPPRWRWPWTWAETCLPGHAERALAVWQATTSVSHVIHFCSWPSLLPSTFLICSPFPNVLKRDI